MPRPGRPGRGSNEKANDFGGAMKRLFVNMKKWRILMVIAIILAMASSIFSLISPNKLSDITDAITEGIAPDTDKIQEITEKITANFSDEEKMASKMQEIMMDSNISNEDKQAIQGLAMSMGAINSENMPSGNLPTDSTEIPNGNLSTDSTDMPSENIQAEDMQEMMSSMPDSVMLALLEPIEIDGVTISSQDQLDTLNLLGKIDKDDMDSALKTFDELPESVYELIKPKMDMNYIKGIAIFLLTLYIIGAIFSYVQNFMLSTVSNRFAQNLRTRISNKINKLPLRYFDLHETGDILSRVTNDVDTIAHNLNNSLGSLVSATTLFIGCIVMMFYTNWIMAMTAILASLVGFILMFLILRKISKIL